METFFYGSARTDSLPRSHSETCEHRRSDVDEAAMPVDETVVAETGTRNDERRTCLDDTERTMFAAVVLAFVRRGVENAEIWSARVVEELGYVFECVRIAVLAPLRVQ